MAEFKFDIEQHIGILSKSDDGIFTTEVNMISYVGNRPKLDIRRWNKRTGKMLKGVALNWEETQKLLELLQDVSSADFR